MSELAPKSKGLVILQNAEAKPEAQRKEAPSRGHILAKDLLSAIEGKDSDKMSRVLDSLLRMTGVGG